MDDTNEKNKKRTGRRPVLLCTFAYFISYVTRVDLAAVLVAVEENAFSARSDAVLALTLSAVTYGLGQLVSGWLGDRYDPRRVALCGLLLTAACNVFAGAAGGAALAPLWAVNGLAQAFMWPPIVRILAANLGREEYNRACVWVNWGASVGTMAVYLTAPAVIKSAGIRFVFFGAGAAAVAAAAVWAAGSRSLGVSAGAAPEEPGRRKEITGAARVCLLAPIMAAILIQGALRDGISNWMPTYISENFGLDSSSAVLSGALLPVCGALAYILTQQLHKRLIKNELAAAAAVFALGAGAAAVIRFAGSGSAALSIVCLALAAGSMHGVNLILICMVPPFFARKGKVALISGVMNAGVYLGSAAATYGIPLVIGGYGKNGYLDLCLAAAVCGAAVCLAAAPKWKKAK